jgi:membrane associated rhomboid family serine protease
MRETAPANSPGATVGDGPRGPEAVRASPIAAPADADDAIFAAYKVAKAAGDVDRARALLDLLGTAMKHDRGKTVQGVAEPLLATLAIATASLASYLAEMAGGGMSVCQALGFSPVRPSLDTAFLSMWLHDPDEVALATWRSLLVVGIVVEPLLGHRLLFALFVASGLGGGAAADSPVPLMGMSGGLTGLMAVAAAARPCLMLGFVVSYIGMKLVGLFATTPLVSPGVSVGAHLGGCCVGSLVVLPTERLRPGARPHSGDCPRLFCRRLRRRVSSRRSFREPAR